MKFKPNPLLYGADMDFYSSFKLTVTMSDPVDHAALSRAVEVALRPRLSSLFKRTPSKGGVLFLLFVRCLSHLVRYNMKIIRLFGWFFYSYH